MRDIWVSSHGRVYRRPDLTATRGPRCRCPRRAARTTAGRVSRWLFRTLGCGIGLWALSPWSGVHAAESVTPAPLRVATSATAPFILPRTDPPAGFSVDLWNEVARRMHVEFTWQVARDPVQALNAVQNHNADVALGAIAITRQSEQTVDFSIPVFDSGLRIMVPARHEAGFVSTLRSVPWAAIARLLAVGVVIIVLLANVLWFVESRKEKTKELSRGYLATIGEELWGTLLVMATLNVDRDAPGMRRFIILVMWLFGVVLIALLTATVTSTQTVERMQSVIRGPDDLPGKTIASMPGTPAGDYLTERGLPFTTVTYGPDGIRMLTRGEVQAAVFDRATLEYWAAKQGQGLVQVVGPIFRPQKYAIAVPVGSALRRPINQALLEIYADGTYERLYSAWFSVAQ